MNSCFVVTSYFQWQTVFFRVFKKVQSIADSTAPPVTSMSSVAASSSSSSTSHAVGGGGGVPVKNAAVAAAAVPASSDNTSAPAKKAVKSSIPAGGGGKNFSLASIDMASVYALFVLKAVSRSQQALVLRRQIQLLVPTTMKITK